MNSKLLATYEALDARANAKLLRSMRRQMRQLGNSYCVGAVGYRTRYYHNRAKAVARYRLLKGRGEHPFLTSMVFNVTVRYTPVPPRSMELRQLMSLKMMQPLRPLPRITHANDNVARALITPKTREMLGCRLLPQLALPSPESMRMPYAVML
jgi:hypothetical protein